MNSLSIHFFILAHAMTMTTLSATAWIHAKAPTGLPTIAFAWGVQISIS